MSFFFSILYSNVCLYFCLLAKSEYQYVFNTIFWILIAQIIFIIGLSAYSWIQTLLLEQRYVERAQNERMNYAEVVQRQRTLKRQRTERAAAQKKKAQQSQKKKGRRKVAKMQTGILNVASDLRQRVRSRSHAPAQAHKGAVALTPRRDGQNGSAHDDMPSSTGRKSRRLREVQREGWLRERARQRRRQRELRMRRRRGEATNKRWPSRWNARKSAQPKSFLSRVTENTRESQAELFPEVEAIETDTAFHFEELPSPRVEKMGTFVQVTDYRDSEVLPKR